MTRRSSGLDAVAGPVAAPVAVASDPQASSGACAAVLTIVVSYNRRLLLGEVLDGVRSQDAPSSILVIDNASTDGTVEWLRGNYPDVELIVLDRNLGGAGGFALGMREGLSRPVDFCWLLDDDAVPQPGALSALLAARADYGGPHAPAAVASHVVWIDGRVHRMNIPRARRDASAAARDLATDVGCWPMRTASFCSLLIDAEAARREKLPVADYFLWNDDFEYTARLLRRRVGLVCPASLVVHKTASYYNSGSAPGDRFFYDVRNMVWLLARTRSLTPSERLFFTAVAARRFVRTIYRSKKKRLGLIRALGRGLGAGLARGPQPTEAVLATAHLDRG